MIINKQKIEENEKEVKDKYLLNSENSLIFCGRKMDFDLLLMHYNTDLLKKEIIYVLTPNAKKYTVMFDNKVEYFYCFKNTFSELKRLVSL